MKLAYFLSFVLFSNIIITQNNIEINEDALKYFNSYLTNKSVIDDVKGELSYNKYSNELSYKSTTVMYENPTTEKDIYFKMTVTFSIPIAELNKIEEIILQKGEIIIVQYKFHLNEKVKRTIETKEKGKWLDKKTTYDNTVFLSPNGKINLTDLTKIKSVFRDIFSNIEIKSKIEQR
ncbi:hypothetical protein [Tenacibaculum dicentrarchi]|uniref:hypothetical protein n=1 Tax=Tenacibaculum dicentrarchi TaxID=669041 RepID=UPI000C7DB22F|nr:hypothetical protein TDCHD05_40006 [Tenacibaculum dicentrarchi]